MRPKISSGRCAWVSVPLLLAAASCGSTESSRLDASSTPDVGAADASGGARDGMGADGTGGADGADGSMAAPACRAGAEVSRWATWPMPDPPASGTAHPQSYEVRSPDIVVDNVTGLMWQRNADTRGFAWAAAKDHCACLTLGGFRDWRLPSRIELVSIVDSTRHDPAIDPSAFPGTPVEYFWTSSALAGDPAVAWYIAFFDGNTHPIAVDTEYRARCVRGTAGLPEHRYQVMGDGTVNDTLTKLTWQATVDPADHTWDEAKRTCAGLALAGTGWRLPTMKELQTLIDESTTDPAIDAKAFPGTPAEAFWASSPLADMPDYAWFVSFDTGVAYNSLRERPHLVRCVR